MATRTTSNLCALILVGCTVGATERTTDASFVDGGMARADAGPVAARDAAITPRRPIRSRALRPGVRCALDVVRYGAPGPDGTWRTVDDEPTEWSTEEIDSSLRASTTLDYVEPGSDGAWGTDDDRIGSAGRAAFADLGLGTIRRFEWRLLSSEAGTDGAWATEDDPVAHYYAYVYGSDGELVSSSEAVSSGEDAVWETSDDGVATRTRYAWIDHDIAFRATVARGPTDVPWDFDTGTPFLAWHLQRDATAGTLESRLSSAPGPDGVWGTSDDPVAFRSSSACSDGSTFETSHFSESGDDGVWGTRDDVIVREETWTATGDCPASVCALVAPF